MKQAPVLTERDVKRVLQHCAQTAFPARNRAVFQLGYLSGMRIGEIAALKVSDVLAEEVISNVELHDKQDHRGHVVKWLNDQRARWVVRHLLFSSVAEDDGRLSKPATAQLHWQRMPCVSPSDNFSI